MRIYIKNDDYESMAESNPCPTDNSAQYSDIFVIRL